MKWKSSCYNEKYIEEKTQEFQRNEVITKLLLNRNILNKEEADDFLNPNYKQLHDPFLLEDMQSVVDKILEYRKQGKKVLIFGDYDIDGISGSMYLSKILENLGMENTIYIPERNMYKYTIEDDFYKKLHEEDIKLIITVDNSFGSENDFEKLKQLGVDILITDHHFNNRAGDDILEINPKKSKSYPFKDLSGTGVVFKLAQALYSVLELPISQIYEYSELIALATIADVMEISDENRFLIKRGMKNFKYTKFLSLKMIMETLSIEDEYISINDISYRLAPLINSIWKLDNPNKIIKFLTSDSLETNNSILREMYRHNTNRKTYEANLYSSIVEEIKSKHSEIKYIYYECEDINLSVLGSVSSKLTLEYKVPVILLTRIDGMYKASCRSYGDNKIYGVIEQFSDYFLNFGGHDMAAGFLIEKEKLDLIRKDIKKSLENIHKISVKEECKELFIDSHLPISQLSKKLLREINSLGPFGISNKEPNFIDYDISFSNLKIFGINNSHFRANVYKNGREIDIIGYNLTNKLNLKKVDKLYKIVYTPEIVKKGKLRLRLKDIEEKNRRKK